MKTWKTITLTALATLSISAVSITTYSLLNQPQHEIEVSSNSSSNEEESTTTASSSSVEEQTSKPVENKCVGTPALQPTYEMVFTGITETNEERQEMACVVHRPTGDKTKALTASEAKQFMTYMEYIGGGKTKLTYTMQENYDYWTQHKGE